MLVIYGTLNTGIGCFSDSFACSFPPIGLSCPDSIQRPLPYCIVFYFVLFGYCLLVAGAFLKGNRGGLDVGKSGYEEVGCCEE